MSGLSQQHPSTTMNTEASASLPAPHPKSKRFIDLTGRRFGRLSVLRYHGRVAGRRHTWKCVCDCGAVRIVHGGNLRLGTSTSCGCWSAERIVKHRNMFRVPRKPRHPEYDIWTAMNQRCRNPNSAGFKIYGGRGIEVCERWLKSFDNFIEDMGPRPTRLHSIERRDNNLGYSKDNCCWATRKEQNNNRRNNHRVTIGGVEKTMAQWCHDLRLRYHVVNDRFRLGWTAEEAFEMVPTRRFRTKSAKLMVLA